MEDFRTNLLRGETVLGLQQNFFWQYPSGGDSSFYPLWAKEKASIKDALL